MKAPQTYYRQILTESVSERHYVPLLSFKFLNGNDITHNNFIHE